MNRTEGGKRKNNTHLTAVHGSLLKGCDPAFVKQYAEDSLIPRSYLQQVLTSAFTINSTPIAHPRTCRHPGLTPTPTPQTCTYL